jgi:hypothetical protein
MAQNQSGMTAGVTNRGGGGGASAVTGGAGGAAGGSGVVIIRVPSTRTATFSAGVTQTSAVVGSDRVYTVTAAGVSDTVTFS